MATPIGEMLQAAPNAKPEELARIPTFEGLSPDAIEWLASEMRELRFGSDEVMVRKGDPAEYMVVLLEGEFRSDLDSGRVFIVHAGSVTGMLPFSRLETFPANARTTQPTRIAALHKDRFADMLHRIPELQARLVSVIADRVRETTMASQQREKLTALGKLSAGLAHELNNPASAARRAADNLRQALNSVRSAALKLDKGGLPQESRIYLAMLECDWEKTTGPQCALDSLDRSDREDQVSEWLRKRQIEAAWDLAAALVDLGCTIETLEDIERHVPPHFLNDVLIKITAAFTIGRLADQIASATDRISELIRAIKEYSYMDQAPEQKVDIHDGIENTLIMLHHKLKQGVNVIREYDRSMPKVQARGSELNQIWTNLIINANDAMKGKGNLTIRTQRDHNCARVEIIDDGPGIPDKIKPRIFEPFFTTKPIGDGSGLGLDVVQRIAHGHGGDVTFESRPGETRFTVRIPFGRTSSNGTQ
jgi:signal transduction histidine kinase